MMTESLGEQTAALHVLIDEAKELNQVNAGLALRKWREATDTANELCGTTYNTSLFCRNNYARALLELDILPEALEHFTFLRTTYESKPPLSPDSLVMVYQDLARVHSGQNNFELSLSMWTKAFELSLKLHGLEYRMTNFCERKLANALVKARRYREALKILERHFANTKVVDPKSKTAALYARDIGYCLNHLERHADAACYLAITKEIFEEIFPPEDPELVRLYGSLHWTRKRVQEVRDLRARQRLERRELIREVLKTDHDVEVLERCDINHEQTIQVLLRLRETYAAAEGATTLRMIRKPMRSKKRAAQASRLRKYVQSKESGLGTAYDEEFVAKGKDGDDVVLMIGYHIP